MDVQKKNIIFFITILVDLFSYGARVNENNANTIVSSPEGRGENISLKDTITVHNLSEVVVNNESVVRKGKIIELFPGKRDRKFASGGIDVIANMNIPEL